MEKHEQITNFSILAKNAIDAGDAAEANVYYNKMLELDPVRPDAWLGKARAMAISATLLDFKVEPMMSAIRNALKFSPPEVVETTKDVAVSALTTYCLSVMGLVDAYAKVESSGGNYSTPKGMIDKGFQFAEAALKKRRRTRELFPLVAQALELKPSDIGVLNVAVLVVLRGKTVADPFVSNSKQMAKEDDALLADYESRMRAINPSYVSAATCFPASARVLTPTGYRAIATIAAGDVVLSWSPNGLVERLVERRLCHAPRVSQRVVFRETEEPLLATSNHMVRAAAGGWVRVSALRSGMRVMGARGPLTVISAMREQETDLVYNLITEVDHNFIVDGVVVHNFARFLAVRSMWRHLVSTLRGDKSRAVLFSRVRPA